VLLKLLLAAVPTDEDARLEEVVLQVVAEVAEEAKVEEVQEVPHHQGQFQHRNNT
jgi:hypothetical protein